MVGQLVLDAVVDLHELPFHEADGFAGQDQVAVLPRRLHSARNICMPENRIKMICSKFSV